jgi:hypothetical protein
MSRDPLPPVLLADVRAPASRCSRRAQAAITAAKSRLEPASSLTFSAVSSAGIERSPIVQRGSDHDADRRRDVCVKFCKGFGLGGLAELGFFVLFEVVHVEVAVCFEPVLVSFDGKRSDEAAA